MSHHEPADRLPRAVVGLVGQRHLDEAAELQQCPGPCRPPPQTSCAERIDVRQTTDVGADREADPVGETGRRLDRLRPRRGDVDSWPLDTKRRVDVVESGHGHGHVVEIDVHAPQEALQPREILLELRDPHRLLPEHLHGSVAAAETEASPAVRKALKRRHRTSREERMPQWNSHRGSDLERRRRGRRDGERGVRIGQQPVGLADSETVPATRLELAREPADLADRDRRRSHAPELGHRESTVHALTPGAP